MVNMNVHAKLHESLTVSLTVTKKTQTYVWTHRGHDNDISVVSWEVV